MKTAVANDLINGSFNQHLLEKATLKPHESTTVLLGVYEDTIPQPDFTVESSSDAVTHPSITARLVRINNNGDYSLSYYLQNDTDDLCEIMISERCVA